jgi:hypothetical protein
MKKKLSIVFITFLLGACNNNSSTTAAPTDSSKITNSGTDTTVKLDTTHFMVSPTAGEGDLKMKDGKMMILKNGSWEELEESVTLSNGAKVSPNGKVILKGKIMKMSEGYIAQRNGVMKDQTGKTMNSVGTVARSGNDIEKSMDSTHK